MKSAKEISELLEGVMKSGPLTRIYNLGKAAPDLAETCLALYAKLEEMEKEKALCLQICQERNGLPYCKNCGLKGPEID